MEDRTRRVKKDIPEDLWLRAKAQAAINKMTITEFIAQAVKNELARVGALHSPIKK
ncbi:MAG: hypothetical protein WC359_12995 [Dehalococcoidia bacterium]|jgi:hypothetical protein